ncbi:MAG TPA: response regulator, partial [Nitrospiria bacterium]
VVSTQNGQEFIASFTKRLAENKPVDLVILDLEMPVMDGITAARVMRVVESKYRTVKVPILFFSARKCDETLKQQLSLFSPASYVNKGNDSDPAKLVERIDQLVGYLLSKRETAAS